jgi:integrase
MHDKSMTTPVLPPRGKGKPVAVVKHGSAAVPIYKGNVRGTKRFTVAFYRNGQRERRTFGTLDEARDEARTVALNIQRGMASDNDMRPQDREAFQVACAMIEPFGIPLVTAVEEYARCRRKLGETPLMTSVEEFVRRARGFTAGVLVPRLVEDFIALKVQDRMSSVYLKGLRSILRMFAKASPGEIAKVTTQEVDAWLRSGDHSAVTRNNRLKCVKLLFSHARQCGFLPRGEPTAAEGIKRQKHADTDVGIFKPEQMEQLLRAAPVRLIPVLAIGGFAGLRGAEIARLDWSAVDLNRRIIELRAGQAKTASRRIVPISDNLAAWLSPLQRQGPVVPEKIVFVKLPTLAKSLGIQWPHNALRHSYISYRIAVVQSAAQVALEAGNSPTIIFKHYRELVTKDEADKWFGVMPENPR